MGYLGTEAGGQIYFEHYPSAGRTLVLSHGWGMNSRVWDNTVARLQDAGFGALIYDHRCCGQSDKDFADVSIDALGDDLVALCRRQQLARPVLGGWSLGGAVVVNAAEKLGADLGGLVLIAAATPRYTQAEGFAHGGQPEDVAATVAALRADRVNFLRGLYFDGAFARDPGEAVKHWCWHLALQASSGADASLAELANLDQRRTLEALDCPALVVVGGQDAVVPPGIGRDAAERLAGAELAEFLDCGHAPFLEDPEAYHAALLTFLEALPA